MRELVGEPSPAAGGRRLRARRRGLPGRRRARARARRDPVQRVQPRDRRDARRAQRHAPRARDACAASSTARPFELAMAGAAIVSNPVEGLDTWFEPGRELRRRPRRGRGDVGVPRAARRPGRGRGARRPRPRAGARRAHVRAPRAAPARARRPRRAGDGRVSDVLEEPYVVEQRVRALRRMAIVPAFNEEASVGRVVDELRAFDPDLEIVVVDDGSTDRTAQVARDRGARVVSLPFNLGIGGAVQTGFRYAWEHGLRHRGARRRRRPARSARARRGARAGPRRRLRRRGRLALHRPGAATAPRARAGSGSGSSRGSCPR